MEEYKDIGAANQERETVITAPEKPPGKLRCVYHMQRRDPIAHAQNFFDHACFEKMKAGVGIRCVMRHEQYMIQCTER